MKTAFAIYSVMDIVAGVLRNTQHGLHLFGENELPIKHHKECK